MKPLSSVATFALALSLSQVHALADSSELDWLLGCWSTQDGGSREVWVRQSDEQLIGFGVALQDGNLAFYEVLSIRLRDDGIHYTAHPKGQATATFSASGASGQEISFTNAEHDYPQRITYRLDGEQLRATISLLDGSNPNSFDKSRCP